MAYATWSHAAFGMAGHVKGGNQMNTLNAKAVAQTISLECPKCEAPIFDPDTESYMITSDSFRGATKFQCPDCGVTLTFPKTAKLFAD